jgi:hypothetical protein
MSRAQEVRREALVDLIRASGLSVEGFARRCVARSPGTVYRWLSGDRPIPTVMAEWIAGDGPAVVEAVAYSGGDDD